MNCVRIVFLIFIFPISVAGQSDYRPGWIVMSQGDTLQGLVQYQISNKIVSQCKFKKSKSEGMKVYSPGQLLSFGYSNGKVFMSIDTALNVSPIFMENIIRGDIASLYRYGKLFYLEKDSLYKLELQVNKLVDQNVFYEQQKKKYAGVLNYLFGDCGDTELSSEVMKADYNEPDLSRLTIKYNRCRNSEFIDFRRGQMSTRLNYYLTIGLAYNKFSYESGIYPFRTDRNVKLSGVTPVFGAGLNLSTPRITENMTFNLEVQISNYTFNQSLRRQEATYLLLETYDLSYLRIKAPVGFKIDFSSASSSIYLRAGFAFNFYSNGRIRATQSKDFQTSPDTFISDDSELEGFRMSQLFLGTGVQFPVSRALRGFVELRGEAFGGNGNQLIRVDDVVVIQSRSMNSNTLNLILGLVI